MNPLTKKLTLFALITISLLLTQSRSHGQNPDPVQVQVIANPAQSFVVCAREVQGDGSVILIPKDDGEPPDKPASTTLITTQPQTHLQLFSPSRCTPWQIQQHPFPAKGIIHSEWPFLAKFGQNGKKNNARRRHLQDNDGSFPFLLPPSGKAQPSISTMGGGSFGPDDDDQQHRRPYWHFSKDSGDIDLTLLGGFQLSQMLGDFLPDHAPWQAVINLLGMGNSPSNTLWVYPENQPEALTSIQVSPEEMEALADNLTGEQSLNWLIQKLRPDHREALIQQLLALQEAYDDSDAVLSEPALALIRERLVEVLDKSSTQIDLEFEHFRLRRDLEEATTEAIESLVLAHRPDTGTVYEDGEVNKLIYQAGDKPPKSDGVQFGNNGRTKGADDQSSEDQKSEDQEEESDEEVVKSKHPSVVSAVQGGTASPLRIVLIGQQNVGKSSLGRGLVKSNKYFTVTTPVNYDRDQGYRSNDIEIISLPGYGSPSLQGKKTISPDDLKTIIKPADLVILVTSNEGLNQYDQIAIRFLFENKIRFVIVRNKWSDYLDQLTRVLSPEDREKEAQKARKSVENEYRLVVKEARLDDNFCLIAFTDSYDLIKLNINELIDAIESSLSEGELKYWNRFLKSRVELFDLQQIISDIIIQEVEGNENPASVLEKSMKRIEDEIGRRYAVRVPYIFVLNSYVKTIKEKNAIDIIAREKEFLELHRMILMFRHDHNEFEQKIKELRNEHRKEKAELEERNRQLGYSLSNIRKVQQELDEKINSMQAAISDDVVNDLISTEREKIKRAKENTDKIQKVANKLVKLHKDLQENEKKKSWLYLFYDYYEYDKGKKEIEKQRACVMDELVITQSWQDKLEKELNNSHDNTMNALDSYGKKLAVVALKSRNHDIKPQEQKTDTSSAHAANPPVAANEDDADTISTMEYMYTILRSGESHELAGLNDFQRSYIHQKSKDAVETLETVTTYIAFHMLPYIQEEIDKKLEQSYHSPQHLGTREPMGIIEGHDSTSDKGVTQPVLSQPPKKHSPAPPKPPRTKTTPPDVAKMQPETAVGDETDTHLYESLQHLSIRDRMNLSEDHDSTSDEGAEDHDSTSDEGDTPSELPPLLKEQSLDLQMQMLQQKSFHIQQGQDTPPPATPPHMSEELKDKIKANIRGNWKDSKKLLDQINPKTRGTLKKRLAKTFELKRPPSSKLIFEEGFYRKGIIVLLLYSEGVTDTEMASISGSSDIIDWFQASEANFSVMAEELKASVDYAQWEPKYQTGYDDFLRQIFRAIQADPKVSTAAQPPTPKPLREPVNPVDPEAGEETDYSEAVSLLTDSLAQRHQRVAATGAIPLEGGSPFTSNLTRYLWIWAARTFDAVYSRMAAHARRTNEEQDECL